MLWCGWSLLLASFILSSVGLCLLCGPVSSSHGVLLLPCLILAEKTRRFLKCVKSGNLDEVARLLRTGVDVNRRHPLGWTGLHTAAVCGNTQCV